MSGFPLALGVGQTLYSISAKKYNRHKEMRAIRGIKIGSDDIENQIRGNILAPGQLTGTYRR